MTRTERGVVAVAQERATVSLSEKHGSVPLLASPLADPRASTAATPTEVESR